MEFFIVIVAVVVVLSSLLTPLFRSVAKAEKKEALPAYEPRWSLAVMAEEVKLHTKWDADFYTLRLRAKLGDYSFYDVSDLSRENLIKLQREMDMRYGEDGW